MDTIQHSYLKVSDYRKKKRLWIQGLRLAQAGFERGAKYRIDYNMDSGQIEIVLDPNGNRVVSGIQKGERVDSIIDICNSELVQVTGTAERVRVDFAHGRLTVSVHHLITKQEQREKLFREHVAAGKLTEGSVCAGIGVAAAGLKQGFADAGIDTSVSWVVDRERKYLEVAARNNPAIAGAKLFEASLEELEPHLLGYVDVCQVSLPCTGHSQSGKSKNGIEIAEQHVDASAVLGFMNILNHVNPAVIVSENVTEARDSATYLLLKSMLALYGYIVHELDMDHEQAGSLEKRARWWFVAVSAGLPELDLSTVTVFARQYATLGDALEDVAADDPAWSDNQYLKDKQVRDAAAGKGFANRCLVTPESTHVNTLGRGYQKRRSTEAQLTRPEIDAKERLLTPVEHARVKGIPESFIAGFSASTAHEGLGQSVLFNHPRGLAGAIVASVIRPLLAGRVQAPVFQVEAVRQTTAGSQLAFF